MWRRTAAQLRNRLWLDSWPVEAEVQWAHMNRVTQQHPSPPLTGPADDESAALVATCHASDYHSSKQQCEATVHQATGDGARATHEFNLYVLVQNVHPSDEGKINLN